MRVGVDMVEVERIERALTSRGRRFTDRVFTRGEVQYCDARRTKYQSYAVRFAAKEAVSKLIGTGFLGFLPCDIEVVTAGGGRPEVILHRRAKAAAALAGIESVEVSLSHVGAYAVAVAVAGRELGE